ncbi:hypothetical protein [Shewanella sp. 0m-4]
MNLELTGRYKPFNTDKDAIAIWQFLNHKETIIRMETATYLGRPALEALVAQLLEKFGHCFDPSLQPNQKTIDEFKKLTGHMVRKVMEEQGYKYVKSGLKVRTGIFVTASLYSLK